MTTTLEERYKEELNELENSHVTNKVRAVQLLKEFNENHKRLQPIYDAVEASRKDRVLDIFEVGEYIIAKFETEWEGARKEMYQPFVNFKKTGAMAFSLDEALVIALAYKNDDRHVIPYACRVLNISHD